MFFLLVILFLAPGLQLPNFAKFLSTMRQNTQVTAADHVRGMDRFFGLIELKNDQGGWVSITSDDIACDPKLLVGVLSSNVHERLEDLSLFDMKYSWTAKLFEGLMAFSRWQIHELDGKLVDAIPGPWQHYKAAVVRLLTILEGGLSNKLPYVFSYCVFCFFVKGFIICMFV